MTGTLTKSVAHWLLAHWLPPITASGILSSLPSYPAPQRHAGTADAFQHALLTVGATGPDSGACMVSLVPTEPSPQPCLTESLFKRNCFKS